MHFRLLGLQNSKSIDSVRIATQNLSKEEAKAVIVKSNLSNKEKESLLVKKGYTDVQAKEIVTQKASVAADEQEIASTSRLTMAKRRLQGVVTGLGGAFKGFFKSLITNPFFLITTAVTFLVQLFDTLIVTTEEYNEKLSESSQKYSETVSEIKSLNTELETTKARINELENKDKLTITEENELYNLQNINAELERKIELEERNRMLEASNASKDFVNAVKSNQTEQGLTFDNPITGYEEHFMSLQDIMDSFSH